MGSSAPARAPDSPLLAAVEALGFEALGRSAEGRPIRGPPVRRARARPCWSSAASTATSRPASRRCSSSAARLAGAPRPAPLWLLPAAQPRRPRARARRTRRATSISTGTSRPVPSATAHAPGYFPGAGAAVRAGDARARRPRSRATPCAAVVAVHAPFACVNYDGPAGGLGRGGGRRLRLAGARRHRLSDARARSAAGWGSIGDCPS